MVKKYIIGHYLFNTFKKSKKINVLLMNKKTKDIFFFINSKKLMKHKYYSKGGLQKYQKNRFKKYIKNLVKKYFLLIRLSQLKNSKQTIEKNLYKLLINFFIKDGNVSRITKIMDKIFTKLIHEFKISKRLLLLKIFTTHIFYVEVKKIKSRRRINHVPFLIKQKRSFYLILSWLREAVKNNKQTNRLEDSLYRELYNLITLKQSKVFESIENNNKLAILNRSKIHFRW